MGIFNKLRRLTDPGPQEVESRKSDFSGEVEKARNVPLADFWVRASGVPGVENQVVTVVETQKLIAFNKPGHLLTFMGLLRTRLPGAKAVRVGTYAIAVQWEIRDPSKGKAQNQAITSQVVASLCKRLTIEEPRVYYLTSEEAGGYRMFHGLMKNRWYGG